MRLAIEQLLNVLTMTLLSEIACTNKDGFGETCLICRTLLSDRAGIVELNQPSDTCKMAVHLELHKKVMKLVVIQSKQLYMLIMTGQLVGQPSNIPCMDMSNLFA